MWLTDRETWILKCLLENKGYITIEHLENILSVSRRCIYYDIDKINLWLEKNNLDFINKKRSRGYFLTDMQKTEIYKILPLADIPEINTFTLKERLNICICLILFSRKPVRIENVQNVLNVSRNTIFSDLNKVREKLKTLELTLKYTQQDGYYIEGKSEKKRLLFLNQAEELLINVENGKVLFDYFFSCESQKQITSEYDKLVQIEKTIDVEYNPYALNAIAILIHCIKNNIFFTENAESNNESIKETLEYQLINRIYSQLNEYDKVYIVKHLVGYKYQQSNKSIPKDEYKKISMQLIDEFSKLSAVDFQNQEELCDKIALHLEWSSYRYLNGIYIDNPLLDKIKENYSEIFEITNQACDILRNCFAAPINDNEVGYLTLYFGGYIKNINHHSTIKVLLICAEGSSTSYMLRNEIGRLSDDIEIIDNISLKSLENYHEYYDMIISTLKVYSEKTSIQVNPIITEADKQVILSYVNKQKAVKVNNVVYRRIFHILSNYLDGENLINATDSVLAVLEEQKEQKKDYIQSRVRDVFKKENIKILNTCDSWEKAIFYACENLIDKSVITEEYYRNIIKNVYEHGPYFVVADKIALAHPSTTAGARTLGLSLLILKNDVDMLSKKVNMIFVISLIDKESHLNILKNLMKLFKDKKTCEEIRKLNSEEKIYSKILEIVS